MENSSLNGGSKERLTNGIDQVSIDFPKRRKKRKQQIE